MALKRLLLAAAALACIAAPAVAQQSMPVGSSDAARTAAPVLVVGSPASGVAPVSSTVSAAGASSSFTPQAGRSFHVQLSGVASATCYLERQLDGTTWTPITVTANGSTTTMHNWTYTGSALSEDEVESQTNVPYRVDCGAQLGAFTSGSLGVRLSQ